MTRGQALLLAGLAIAAVAVWAVLLGQLLDDGTGTPSPDVAVVATDPPATGSAVPTSPTSSPSASADPTAVPSEATPSPDPVPTDPPAVGSGGRPAFLAFLARMDAARASAEALNADLRTAGEASDQDAVRATAADMDDLVDREEAWLDANPPDPCFADAHGAAHDLLDAYGSVAAASTAWADASGLDVLAALSDLYEAVEGAATEAADIAQALEAVSCPA